MEFILPPSLLHSSNCGLLGSCEFEFPVVGILAGVLLVSAFIIQGTLYKCNSSTTFQLTVFFFNSVTVTFCNTHRF